VSGGRRSDDEEPGSFADAMSDVVPLEDRDKLRRPPERRSDPPEPARRPSPGFRVRIEAGHVEGRAEDVGRRTLAALRRGEYPVDESIDLHGLDADAARRTLIEAFEANAPTRCLRIVHGRGLHSEDRPVLKESLPDWLQRSPLSWRVMAFASAPARQGGPGATLVLLRRAR
jgi:DNA-nicking Smr family endonuclease